MLPHVECAIWMLHEVYLSEQEWCYYKLHTSKVKLHGIMIYNISMFVEEGIEDALLQTLSDNQFFQEFLVKAYFYLWACAKGMSMKTVTNNLMWRSLG
jgi:hypothetical protein